MSETKNECEIVNRLSRKVEKELSENMTLVKASLAEINEKIEDMAVINDTSASDSTTYSSEKIEDLISDIPTGAEIDDTTASTTTTYSSEKIEDLISDIPTGAEIDDSTEALTTTWSSSKIKTEIDGGGGGGSLEPTYSMAKRFNSLSTSYMEKINTLTDFPDITIAPGRMYLVNWGVYRRGTGGVDSMNANFRLEILSNNQVQRAIEVNQPNGGRQQIFGTSIQPFTLLVNTDATNIGFKLYGNNSNGEKAYTFDFVMNIYDLGEIK